MNKILTLQLMKRLLGLLMISVFFFSSCKRDDYYIDGGIVDPNFQGTVMQYLESKPIEFDTIAQIIKLAGLEETFHNEEFTFFAPRDRSIKTLIGDINIGGLNRELFLLGRDTVVNLEEVDPLIWRTYLQRHMFKGKYRLADYPQIDMAIRSVFPGENYYSYSSDVCNIGVIFNDAGGVRYLGYRQLVINYIPDISRPDEGWREARIASSDIQPTNGIVHVLNVQQAEFGFSHSEVRETIINSRR